MKVTIDLDACICSAYCIDDAPDVFAMNNETATLYLLNENPDESRREAVEQAVKDCPARAISLS